MLEIYVDVLCIETRMDWYLAVNRINKYIID